MIVQLDLNFNEFHYSSGKTISSKENHGLLIHFSTDDSDATHGFLANIYYLPSIVNCADYMDETELVLTQAIDCNWIITAPSATSTITIKFQFFEVFGLTL